jgi:hypothetical protein
MAKYIDSRRGAENAERDLQVFAGATIVAPADNGNHCIHYASARKQGVNAPVMADLSVEQKKHAATVRSSVHDYKQNNRYYLCVLCAFARKKYYKPLNQDGLWHVRFD